jgi:hypothetical protein
MTRPYTSSIPIDKTYLSRVTYSGFFGYEAWGYTIHVQYKAAGDLQMKQLKLQVIR